MTTTKKTKSNNGQQIPVEESIDWSQYGQGGFESTSADDLGIPFLVICQKGNPEVDEAHPKHAEKRIDTLKVGGVFNSLTREILYNREGEQFIEFLPCYYQKLYVEWQPRESGGGIVRSHPDPVILSETRKNEKGLDVLRSGNIVVTTAYFFGSHLQAGKEPYRAVIGMSSTQLKKARQWLNLMMSLKINERTPPMFSHSYYLTTQAENNSKGNWMGWKIESGKQMTDKALITSSSEFSRKISAEKSRMMLSQPETLVEDEVPV